MPAAEKIESAVYSTVPQKHVQNFKDAMIAEASRNRHSFDGTEFILIGTSRIEHRRSLVLKNDCRRRASCEKCCGKQSDAVRSLQQPVLKPRPKIASTKSLDTLPKGVCDSLARGSYTPTDRLPTINIGRTTSRQGCAS